MRREEFAPDAPGRLVKAPEGHWTFEPAPLPPTLVFEAPLVRRLSEADQALGQLAGMVRMLPNPHLLIRPFVRREAVLSSRIEGTVTALNQLLLFEVQPDGPRQPPDVREVANYVRALESGLRQLADGLPLCLRLLRDVHATLMDGVRGGDRRPGEFRDCPVLIGKAGQSFESARFAPPMAAALPALLRDFERFLNGPGDLPLVVQLALAHYQFEAIHPFGDGNGRVGRLLIALMICERGCLPQPLLYLSAYLEKHDQAYKDHLLNVSRRGAWADWIGFFARGVAEQAHDAVRRSGKLLDLWSSYRRRLQESTQSTAVLRLIDELFAAPYLTVPGAASRLGLTYRAAQQNVEKLVGLSILREVTGKQRNRVYYAPAIMALLDEPAAGPANTEPAGDPSPS